MLQYCYDEEGGVTLQVYTFYRVGIPAFLEKGQEPLPHVLDVLRPDIAQDVNMDKIPQKIREKSVVVEDDLDLLLAAFFALGDMDVAAVKLQLEFFH